MTAYNFQSRFVAPIAAGTKCQTIRGHRRRHTRPGEPMQLYTGQRTKACRKIVADPVCESVTPIRLRFLRGCWPQYWLAGQAQGQREMEQLAYADGFVGKDRIALAFDMVTFWFEHHGHGAYEIDFEGVLIRWRPIADDRCAWPWSQPHVDDNGAP